MLKQSLLPAAALLSAATLSVSACSGGGGGGEKAAKPAPTISSKAQLESTMKQLGCKTVDTREGGTSDMKMMGQCTADGNLYVLVVTDKGKLQEPKDKLASGLEKVAGVEGPNWIAAGAPEEEKGPTMEQAQAIADKIGGKVFEVSGK